MASQFGIVKTPSLLKETDGAPEIPAINESARPFQQFMFSVHACILPATQCAVN